MSLRNLIKPKIVLTLFCIGFLWIVLTTHSIGRNLYFIAAQPQSADILFTFGMDPMRYQFSREIAEMNPIQTWLISDPIQYYAKRLSQDSTWRGNHMGFSSAHSTFTEIIWLANYLEHNPVQGPILLVSTRWHLNRISYLSNKYIDPQFRDQILFVAVPDSLYKQPLHFYPKWYQFSNLRLEVFKTLYYYIWF